MGQVKDNVATKGFSGKLGDEFVFRQSGGRTMFAKRPRKRTTISENQQKQAGVFRDAVFYAKAALLDPIARAEYAALAKQYGLRSAYNAAVTDALKRPEVTYIYTERYSGKVGDVLFATMANDFKVKSLTVTVQRADGTVIETGPATPAENQWQYVVTQANAVVPGTKVIALATDRQGRMSTLEKVLG